MAWVGDGNNVCVSLAEACELLGANFVCASPEGYEPPGLEVVRDPRDAVAGADVVVTDVWASMGQEAERRERLRAFAGYCVDADLLKPPIEMRSLSTAFPPIRARRSRRRCSTGRGALPGTRRRTGCTPRKPSSSSPFHSVDHARMLR